MVWSKYLEEGRFQFEYLLEIVGYYIVNCQIFALPRIYIWLYCKTLVSKFRYKCTTNKKKTLKERHKNSDIITFTPPLQSSGKLP